MIWNKFLINSYKWSLNSNRALKSVDKVRATINSNKINNPIHKHNPQYKTKYLLNLMNNLTMRLKDKTNINTRVIKNL